LVEHFLAWKSALMIAALAGVAKVRS